MKQVDFVFAEGVTTSAWVDLRDEFGTAEDAMEYVMCAANCPASLEATLLSFQMTWDVDSGSPTAKDYQRDDGSGTLEDASVPVAANKVVSLPLSDFLTLSPKIRAKVNTAPAGGSGGRTIGVIFRKAG